MRWWIALATAVCAAIAAGVAWWPPSDFALPPAITVSDIVAELSPPLDGDAVSAERPDDPVRSGELQPGEPLRGAGVRTSLVTPPRSRIRWQVPAAGGSVLLFGVGVDGAGRRDTARSGIRFTVTVDGRTVYERVVNPAATKRDRRWFDERLELGGRAEGPVEIVLGTDAERSGQPLAGTAGWSRVRLVRETTRPRQPARPETPNVLVLLVDTLRADRLGCYGADPSPSPTLDRLAQHGLLFAHAVAQSSWTMPSVASLFSGRHPRSHGAIRDRARGAAAEGDDRGTSALVDAVVTWAEEAARAGITTVGVSSNPLVSRATNLAQGFETFVEFTWDRDRRNWTPAAEVNRVFLGWLRQNRAHRFVGYLHYMEPHDPYTPPAALRPEPPAHLSPALAAGWVRDLANRINWHGAPPLLPAEIAYLRGLYDGEIRAWDAELANLLDGLAALGVRDSTVVIVTADHGEEFQEHGRLTHGSHLYEESIHVPLVVAGPGIRPERRTDLAQGVDLFPTLAPLLRIAAPPGLPGRDLLASREGAPAISETARGIAPDGSPLELVAVTTPDWKLIRVPAARRFELYDLVHDPVEQENRYGGGAGGDELTAVLARWEATVPPPPHGTGDDPAFADRLRALGYVE